MQPSERGHTNFVLLIKKILRSIWDLKVLKRGNTPIGVDVTNILPIYLVSDRRRQQKLN